MGDTTTISASNLSKFFTNGNIDLISVLLSILFAFVIGAFIYWVYHANYRGVMYSRNMGMTLVMMTLITTPVVMCIKSSIELSMGMVGALSIVRFRTAVKDPLDTVYMFWALTMGILLGAGYLLIAVVVAIAIGLLIFVMNAVKVKKEDSYLLVMHYDDFAEQAIERVLRSLRFRHLKSKTVTRMGVEMTVEVRVENSTKLINALLDQEGVHDATLVAYQNEAG
ncbi:MAG: DUF4956 domain-containing protein [Candidatus Fimadaptatus sp.]|jgi:hypothetical protein